MKSFFCFFFSITIFTSSLSQAELFRYEMAKRGQLHTIENSQNRSTTETSVSDHLELIQEHHDQRIGKSKIEGWLLNSSSYDFGKSASTSPSDAWSFARAALEVPSRLPGVFQNNRAKDWQHNFDYAYQESVANRLALDSALSGYRSGIKDYSSRVLKPSVSAGLAEHGTHQSRLSDINQKIDQLPKPSKPTGSGLEGKIENYAKQNLKSNRSIVKWNDQFHNFEKSGDISSLVKNLEAASSLLSSPQTLDLSDTDQSLIRDRLRDWIDSDGLISEAHLSQAGKIIRNGLNRDLRTSTNSSEGTRVRTQLNRGLLLMGLPDSMISQKQEIRETTLGAMSLAIGSDQAYAEGRVADADALIGHATEILDFALGFVPVVSSVNDLTQIVSGMVTGHDYAGNRMSTADYALRGASVVLGLLPAGGEILKIGKSVFSRAAIDGAEAIRASGKGGYFARFLGQDAALAVKTAESLGDANEAGKLAKEIESLIAKKGDGAAKETFELLANSSAGVKSGHLKLVNAGMKIEKRGEAVSFLGKTGDEIARIENGSLTVVKPKGSIPAPSTYLDESYIAQHLAKFENDGAGFIVTKNQIINSSRGNNVLVSRKFVGLKSEMDAVISKFHSSGNDWKVLRDELNLDVVLAGEEIYYIKISKNDLRLKFEIPSGNEYGASEGSWIPGGYTKNGVAEAVLVGSEKIIHNRDIEQLLSSFPDMWSRIQ